LLYCLLGALPTAGEVGHVLYTIHLILKDVIAGESCGSPEIEALTKFVILCLGRAFQYCPVSGKKYGQGGQAHAASAGTINIF